MMAEMAGRRSEHAAGKILNFFFFLEISCSISHVFVAEQIRDTLKLSFTVSVRKNYAGRIFQWTTALKEKNYFVSTLNNHLLHLYVIKANIFLHYWTSGIKNILQNPAVLNLDPFVI